MSKTTRKKAIENLNSRVMVDLDFFADKFSDFIHDNEINAFKDLSDLWVAYYEYLIDGEIELIDN